MSSAACSTSMQSCNLWHELQRRSPQTEHGSGTFQLAMERHPHLSHGGPASDDGTGIGAATCSLQPGRQRSEDSLRQQVRKAPTISESTLKVSHSNAKPRNSSPLKIIVAATHHSESELRPPRGGVDVGGKETNSSALGSSATTRSWGSQAHRACAPDAKPL